MRPQIIVTAGRSLSNDHETPMAGSVQQTAVPRQSLNGMLSELPIPSSHDAELGTAKAAKEQLPAIGTVVDRSALRRRCGLGIAASALLLGSVLAISFTVVSSNRSSGEDSRTSHRPPAPDILSAALREIPTKGYSDVQFIAFTLSTRQHNEGMPGERYVGTSESNNHHFKKDIRAKVNIMRTALERATEDIGLDHRNSTLKVFMAPEFMFRPVNGEFPT